MEFITTNGQKEVKINAASFKDAANLRKALVKCLKDEGILQGSNLADFTNIDISAIFNVLVNLDSSDEFERAVMECLKVCIYDFMGKNIKITPQLFDDIPDAREDYYEIVAKCCEVNLAPFFKSLGSGLKTHFAAMATSTPEQK